MGILSVRSARAVRWREAQMETGGLLAAWQLDGGQVRRQMYEAPHPRERERWHALWLLEQGWTQVQVAQALEHDAHTIGDWVEAFRQQGPAGLQFTAHGGAPPSSTRPSKPH
jgi:Homeodomain-like domain